MSLPSLNDMLKFFVGSPKVCQIFTLAMLWLGVEPLSTQASPALLSLKFPSSPENVGAPRATVGGGVRSSGGQCLQPTAATPTPQVLIPGFLHSPKTTSQTPTLYFYVPDNQGHTGEMTLENILGETIYQNRLTLTPQAGIISITLSPSMPLEVNDVYTWSLRVMCNPAEPSQDVLLTGSFEYVERPGSLPEIPKMLAAQSVASGLAPLTPETTQKVLAIASAYAEQGLWLDSLNLVSIVRGSVPQEWTEFLQSVGFDELMDVPLSDCCQSALPQ